MKTDIQSILNDLYMIDPALKNQEEQLEKLLKQFLKSKPHAKIDEHFVSELRQKLHHETAVLNTADPDYLTSNHSITSMFKRLFLPFAGGVLATAMVLVVLQNLGPSKKSDQNLAKENSDQPMLAMDNQIVEVEPNAFGTLTAASFAHGRGGEQGLTNMPTPPMPLTGGSSMAMTDAAQTNTQSTETAQTAKPTEVAAPVPRESRSMGGGGGMDAKMMIPPDWVPTTYKYVYKGEPVTLSDATVNVFKRVNVKGDSGNLGSMLKNFGFGLMDLSGFQNVRVESVSMIQDGKEGYVVGINFNDSSLSIYQNWAQWDYPTSKCGDDQKCYEQNRLKLSDIPSDETIKSIANQFLQAHKIDLSAYGQPVIQKYWEREMAAMRAQGTPESQLYVPDMINLIYPMMIEGKPAYDQGGNPMGLNVGVSVFHKKVASLSNLKVDQFQSSAYEGVTDWSTIEKYLSSGATPYPVYFEGATQVKEVEVEVSTPEVILMSTWQYKNNESSELFTPALRFPVIKKSEGTEPFYQEAIVVPLAKELLQQYNDLIKPMPLLKDGPAVQNPSTLEEAPAVKPETAPTTPAVPKG